MCYAPLLTGKTEDEYRSHFYHRYCSSTIKTFDDIEVRFKKDDFYHVFFESSDRRGNKDCFSQERAERMDWISLVLQDCHAHLRVGWHSKSRTYSRNCRVALLVDGYVVVIRFTGDKEARFVTAYVASKVPTGSQRMSTYAQIWNSPKW